MPHFLVDIRGDAYLAMGLLAKAGIQNLAAPGELDERMTARVSAESEESARGRVLAALMGEPYEVEAARAE